MSKYNIFNNVNLVLQYVCFTLISILKSVLLKTFKQFFFQRLFIGSVKMCGPQHGPTIHNGKKTPPFGPPLVLRCFVVFVGCCCCCCCWAVLVWRLWRCVLRQRRTNCISCFIGFVLPPLTSLISPSRILRVIHVLVLFYR